MISLFNRPKRARPGIPTVLAVAVSRALALGSTFVALGAHVLADLHLHQRLGQHLGSLPQEVSIPIQPRLAQKVG
ncbi:MAG: hypothetical protein M1401_10435 [Chloroflexi bacterium]|nr:hypothetical protein [Chloroflexota bacterium]